MKKIMMKRSALILTLIFISAAGFAQKAHTATMHITYNYALPMGKFKNDIVSDASPRGFGADFMYNINNKISVGGAFGYQDFYQKYPRDVYNTGDHETTSAVLSNSVQLIPVLAKATYYPLGNSKSFVQPYINGGAGVQFVNFRQYLGEFGGSDNNASLTLQGGAGIAIPFSKGKGSGFNIGANYNYVSYNKFDYSNLNHLSFNAGVYFPLK